MVSAKSQPGIDEREDHRRAEVERQEYQQRENQQQRRNEVHFVPSDEEYHLLQNVPESSHDELPLRTAWSGWPHPAGSPLHRANNFQGPSCGD